MSKDLYIYVILNSYSNIDVFSLVSVLTFIKLQKFLANNKISKVGEYLLSAHLLAVFSIAVSDMTLKYPSILRQRVK